MTNSSVFRVLITMRISPGDAADFEALWREIGESISREPANLTQWMARDADEDDTYHIISDWVSEPRFRAFELSERHLAHRKRLGQYRTGGSMTTMHVLATMPGVAHQPLAEV